MKENCKTSEMRMLHMLLSKTVKGKVSHDDICEMVEVEVY